MRDLPAYLFHTATNLWLDIQRRGKSLARRRGSGEPRGEAVIRIVDYHYAAPAARKASMQAATSRASR